MGKYVFLVKVCILQELEDSILFFLASAIAGKSVWFAFVTLFPTDLCSIIAKPITIRPQTCVQIQENRLEVGQFRFLDFILTNKYR